MCVRVHLPRADRLLRFSIENVSKRLVVYRGAILAFCSSCHPTGRWLATLWVKTWPNGGAIDGCCLRVGSNAKSAYSYKCDTCTCARFWRDRAANVCLASVNWYILHINQLPSSTRPNLAYSGSKLEESMPNTHTQTTRTSRNLLLQTYICATKLATWGVGPYVICTCIYIPRKGKMYPRNVV